MKSFYIGLLLGAWAIVYGWIMFYFGRQTGWRMHKEVVIEVLDGLSKPQKEETKDEDN